MNKKPNGKLGVKLVSLIDERNKLIHEYDAHHRTRLKMESDLDRLTCQIAELSGLEPRSFGPPLKRVRE